MDILRPPPGQQDDEAPPPPRNRFLRFVFAVLFLVIGMVIFFVGGLVVRNPELPNYLLDQIVRRFQGETRGSATTGKAYVSSAENLKPPPPPTTAEQYLNLMSYDENSLPPDERAVASVLNQTTNGLVGIRSPRLAQLFNDQILAGLKNLQPGGDATGIRSAVAECHETANAAIKFYQELPEQLAAKLMAAGVTGSLAHQTAEIFAERAQAKQTISYAANVNLVCKNVTTMVDLLSKSSTKWKRNSNGGVQFTSKAPFEQYNAAAIEMSSAVKALNGG